MARLLLLLCLVFPLTSAASFANSPSLAEEHLARAAEWEERGQSERAAVEYARALALRPDDAYALCALGRISLVDGDADQAMRRFEEALAHDPGNLLAMHLLGMAALHRGAVDEAVGQFESVLARDPAHARAHLGMATAFFARAEDEAAFEHLLAALGAASSDLEVASLSRDVFSWVGLAHSARLAQEMVVEARPRDTSALADLGWRLWAVGDVSLAESAFRQALRLDPLSAEAANALAWLLIEESRRAEEGGNHDRAVRLSDEADGLLNTLAP